MMKRLITLLSVLLLFTGSFAAGEQQELYDGFFGRPSYYPDFVFPSDWPNNMTYSVKVLKKEGGEMITNYEVAVFDQNDSLRTVSRSIAQDDELCTLTIPGTEGDLFHFQIIYGDFVYPEIATARQTCSFETNAIVGNLNAPFWLDLAAFDAIELIHQESNPRLTFDLTGRLIKTLDTGIMISPEENKCIVIMYK